MSRGNGLARGRVIDGPPELTEQDRLAAYGKLLTEAVYGTDPVKVRAARRAIVLMVSIARWQGHPSAMPSDRGAADLPEPRVPLVVTVERAADYLGVPAERIAQVAATLDPWGAHASGEPVWRLRELVPHHATFALLMMALSRLSWALRFRQAMYRRIMLACSLCDT
jgi:hypothetical protein